MGDFEERGPCGGAIRVVQRYKDEIFPCKSVCAGFAELWRGAWWLLGTHGVKVESGLVLDTPLGGGTG